MPGAGGAQRGHGGRGPLGVERGRWSTARRPGCRRRRRPSRRPRRPRSGRPRPPRCRRPRAGCARTRRARCSAASGPRVARNARGRAPVAASTGVGAVAQGLERRGRPVHRQPAAGPLRLRGPRSTGRSARSGNSLTPVIGVRRRARRRRPGARARAATRSASSPESSAATAPPAASSSWKKAQPAAASCVGERLDEPGAAGRVDHPGQVRLLHQQRLGVAGDPPGERRPAHRSRRRTAAR